VHLFLQQKELDLRKEISMLYRAAAAAWNRNQHTKLALRIKNE